MRKLDLAQRKGSNRDRVNDPVVSHYDKKMDYSLPKIRLDATSKKRTQIEYTNDFESKYVIMIKCGGKDLDWGLYSDFGSRKLTFQFLRKLEAEILLSHG